MEFWPGLTPDLESARLPGSHFFRPGTQVEQTHLMVHITLLATIVVKSSASLCNYPPPR